MIKIYIASQKYTHLYNMYKSYKNELKVNGNHISEMNCCRKRSTFEKHAPQGEYTGYAWFSLVIGREL